MDVQRSRDAGPLDLPRLVRDAFRHLIGMVSGEAELIKAEMSEKASRAGIGIAMLVVAVLLALTALDVLAAAAVAALAATGLSAGWAALIVGVIVLVVAVGLVFAGKARLSPSNLTPERSLRQVRKTIERIKENDHYV